MSFWEYVGASMLGFLAAGGGLAIVAYLSREFLGHQLAKSLQRHGAGVETEQQRKRVAFEALHTRRVAVAEELTTVVGDFAFLFVHPPSLDGVGDGPEDSIELRYFRHWKSLRSQGDKALKSIAHALNLFNDQDLAAATTAWVHELMAAVDPFHDAVTHATSEPGHWDRPRDARIARMEAARKQSLVVTPSLRATTTTLNNCLRAVLNA